MPDRLSEVGDIIAHALREMRKLDAADRDGHSEVLARLLAKRPGDTERAYLLAGVAKAAPDRTLDKLAHDVLEGT